MTAEPGESGANSFSPSSVTASRVAWPQLGILDQPGHPNGLHVFESTPKESSSAVEGVQLDWPSRAFCASFFRSK